MLELKEISRSFKNVDAVKTVSLVLGKGMTLVITGPSGSGKTTLLRLIAGLEEPDSGKIYIKDKLVSRRGYVLSPYLRNIGFVFQTPALWPHMNIISNVSFGINRKNTDLDFVNDIFTFLEIDHIKKRYPYEISGGEARRAAIARALAPNPDILLMDEPLVNLDIKLKEKTVLMLKDILKKTGIPMIYVTHDIKEADILNSEVLNMDKGMIKN